MRVMSYLDHIREYLYAVYKDADQTNMSQLYAEIYLYSTTSDWLIF